MPTEPSAKADEDTIEEIERMRRRRRAKSINPVALSHDHHRQMELAVKNASRKSQMIPTVFKYNYKSGAGNAKSPSTVFIAGSMIEWQSREMAALKDESNFLAIIGLSSIPPEKSKEKCISFTDCLPGKYYFKFCVDGEWKHDESQPLVVSTQEVTANVITVKPEDSEVFEALACDSFATKNRNQSSFASKDWSQSKPSMESDYNGFHPPFLPPHLLCPNVLNSSLALNSDPVMLPQPTSHVMIQHLYAQSIKDNLMVLASTTRYRKKCVTVVYYTMIE